MPILRNSTYKKQRPLGVLIFGVLLVITSFFLLSWVPPYEFYSQVNREWPEKMMLIRFVGSYIFKLIGLICGVGVLFLNNALRKFLVGFSWYCLLTLPLRHTYSAMLFFTKPIYEQRGSMFSLEMFTWNAVFACWFIDGLFSLLVIYYFTRPKVVKNFLNIKET